MSDLHPAGDSRFLHRAAYVLLAALTLFSTAFGFIFMFDFNDSHNHSWPMRALGAGSVSLFYLACAAILAKFSELDVHLQRSFWLGFLLLGLLMYGAGVVALREAPWAGQWGIPLICLLPVYLIHLYTGMNRQLYEIERRKAQEEKPGD